MPTAFLMDQDVETIAKIMEVDYLGLVHVAKVVLPGMLERGRGDLINFASIVGWGPTMHFGAYSAAKFAVVAFTEVLYHETRGRGVRIIAVCPPPVATPLLEQATSGPRLLALGKPIPPGRVLDAIERGPGPWQALLLPDPPEQDRPAPPATGPRIGVGGGAPDRGPLSPPEEGHMIEPTDAGVEPPIVLERRDGIATLTLNRPASRNALTAALFLDLERLLLEIEADDAIRVVVLRGAGRGFSAGADLKPLSREERRRTERPSFPGDRGGDILERGNRCIRRLRRLPKPVLGSLHGDAVGIGCSLALATDLRIASDSTRLGVVFSRIGLGPDGGASYFLAHLVGTAKALELLYLGDRIDASEALRLGLVNRVVPEDDLAHATADWADRLAAGPPLAYRAAKAAVLEGRGLPLDRALELEARLQREVGRSEDVREGVQAFLEKRMPAFRGR